MTDTPARDCPAPTGSFCASPVVTDSQLLRDVLHPPGQGPSLPVGFTRFGP